MNDAIKVIQDAEKALALYGYWPSFHDAVVERVTIEREGPTVTILFRTNDAVGEDSSSDLHAWVTIRWHEVQEMSLTGVDPDENNWINGLRFQPDRSGVRTRIEKMDGIDGEIVAARVEVVEATAITR